MEGIASKRCTGPCGALLPVSDYRFLTRTMRYCARCRDCERQDVNARHARKTKPTGKVSEKWWTDAEVTALKLYYPLGGTALFQQHVQGRSDSAIRYQAKQLGLKYEGPPVCGSKPVEDEWAVPAHDYTDADLAMRNWPALEPANDLRWRISA